LRLLGVLGVVLVVVVAMVVMRVTGPVVRRILTVVIMLNV
jgi:hypothetical protein